MNKLIDISIDTAFFQNLQHDCLKEEGYQYLKEISEFAKMGKRQFIALHTSNNAFDILYSQKMPDCLDDNKLSNFIENCGKHEFPIDIIKNIIFDLLGKNDWFDSGLTITIEKIENRKTDIDPQGILSSSPNLQEEQKKLLAKISLMQRYLHPEREYFFFPSKIIKSNIKFSTHITRYEYVSNGNQIGPKPPVNIKNDIIKTYKTYDEMLDKVDTYKLFLEAQDDEDINLLMCIYAHQNNIEYNKEKVRIGNKFRVTAQKLCKERTDIKLLTRQILDLLVKKASGKVDHDERLNNVRNRGKDNADPWRCRITQELRIHYWNCKNGMIEFAAAVDHDCSDIPE
jgi:hypothetical protein